MHTATWKQLGAICLLLAFTGCQKKCQQGPATAFQSITDTEWRLVESDEPQVQSSLTRFTFLIWKFDPTLTGTVINVVDNLKYNNPILTMNYQIDPDQGMLQIKFTAPGAPDANGNPTQGTDQGTSLYAYELARDLRIYDQNKGYYYRFVQFQGIVNPDNTCIF
jgi:hypothetical protein